MSVYNMIIRNICEDGEGAERYELGALYKKQKHSTLTKV